MKKSSLTTAVLAGLAGVVGFAGSSNAVELNPDGTGQVLIYPYYTVNAGQQTLLSVVNSTAVAKAVKVRFLEAYNSREVLDFNLFLSPYDVWTATVYATGDAASGAALATTDNSCTVPSFPATGGVPFADDAYTTGGAGDASPSDTGPTDLSRTREGYIEMISMADLSGASAAAVTHVAAGPGAGVPANCAAAPRSFIPTDMVPPTGGLFGNGYLVDVADGVMYGYGADAIDGFTATTLFTPSGNLNPRLASVNSATPGATAHVFLGGGTLQTLNYSPANAIDAVSAVFQSSALLNTWVADGPSIGTDWVVTFPTKRFYVNNGTAAIAPFVELFGESANGQSCVVVDVDVYDREEGISFDTPEDVFSPHEEYQQASSLCHEVNVVSISDPTDAYSVLGSSDELSVNIPPYGTAGWMRLNLNPTSGSLAEPHALRPDTAGVSLAGLPATGFAATRFVNNNVTPGVLASYSGAFRHRAERELLQIS